MIPKQELVILGGLLIAFLLGWFGGQFGEKKQIKEQKEQ